MVEAVQRYSNSELKVLASLEGVIRKPSSYGLV